MFIDTFLRSVVFPSKWLVITFSTVVTDSLKIHISFHHVSAFSAAVILSLERTQSLPINKLVKYNRKKSII